MSSLFSLRSALVASTLVLCVTLLYPLSGDNALYMYMADLLGKGRLPYLGSWDVNYPGIVFLHAIHVLPFGGSEIAFHFFDILLQLLGCYVVYKLSDELSGSEHAAWLATVLFATYYVAGGLSLCGERDCYIAIMFAASMLLLLRPYTRNAVAALGLMSGAMILLRPTAGIFAAAIFFWLLQEKTGRVKRIGSFAFSAAVLPVLFALVYLIVGGLDEFFEATYTYNVSVYARLQLTLVDFSHLVPYGLFLIGAVVGVWQIASRSKRETAVVLSFVAAAVIYLIPVYKFGYHFHPLMILLAVLAAIGWVAALRKLAGIVTWRFALSVLTVLLCIAFGLSFVKGTRVHASIREFIHSGGDMRASYALFYASPEWGKNVQDSIASYLRSKNARVVQSLTTPMYPMLKAGVVPANRFTSVYNLCWRSPKSQELLPMQIKWREEFITDLTQTPPDYIISSQALPDHVFNNGYLPSDLLTDFPQLQQLLNERYAAEAVIGGYTLHRRR